jgi:hypothetical protein
MYKFSNNSSQGFKHQQQQIIITIINFNKTIISLNM